MAHVARLLVLLPLSSDPTDCEVQQIIIHIILWYSLVPRPFGANAARKGTYIRIYAVGSGNETNFVARFSAVP